MAKTSPYESRFASSERADPSAAAPRDRTERTAEGGATGRGVFLRGEGEGERCASGAPRSNTGCTPFGERNRPANGTPIYVDPDGPCAPFSVGIDWACCTFFPLGRTPGPNVDRKVARFADFLGGYLSPNLVLGAETNGRFGYGKSRKLYWGDEVVGAIRYEGNANSVAYELTGRGTDFLDLDALAEIGSEVTYRVTRADFRFDDFFSLFRSYADWRDFAIAGGFKPARGSLPRLKEYGDLGSGKGSTFYVGSEKSSRLLRIYEKGKELACAEHPRWVRVEVQVRGKEFAMTAADLQRPGAVLKGYPGLSDLPISEGAVGIQRIRRVVDDAHFEKTIRWLRKTAGASLNHLFDALDIEEARELVARDVPSGLERKGLSRDEIALRLREAVERKSAASAA